MLSRGSTSDRKMSNGMGKGTVNDPRGMTHDEAGAFACHIGTSKGSGRFYDQRYRLSTELDYSTDN